MTKPLKINFKKFDKKMAEIIAATDPLIESILDKAGTKAANVIKLRTRRKNIDGEGKPFAPYSPGYIAQKRRRGVSPPSAVNLTSPGQRKGKGKGKKKGSLKGNRQGGTMLNSITVTEKTRGGAGRIITAARAAERKKLARHVRGSGSLPIRDPMGILPNEEADIVKAAQREFIIKIRQLGRR